MRKAQINRKTNETDIALSLDLDGCGQGEIKSGIGFLDHMLKALAVHGGLDLSVTCLGDLDVDGHHSVEDIGITLGQALKEALGDKSRIARYGTSYIPMDEALARCVLDISNRPFLVFNAQFQPMPLGGFDPMLTVEFFRALAVHGGLTIHIDLLAGENDHHKIEAIFKAFAHALAQAKAPKDGILSTKGVL